ncbi:hypothetical protein GCM10009125_28030 [Castellaniella daejeonensis]|uniref:Uncharacterized protein n=1 Tax=Castellaniella daejeonensis TaxID=659013 RepID=A0ABN0U3N5_9BURK
MSTQKFSMPPWQVTAGVVDNPRLIVADVDGLPVCAMSLRGVFGNTKKMEANADLMAAAPDMYDALKSMREYLSKCPPHAEDRTGAEWGRMMDLSGAALARAEGKS